MAHMVEAVALDQPQSLQVQFLVGRHGHLLGVDVVVAVAAQEQPLAVQQNERAVEANLAHAEPAFDRIEGLARL